MMKLTRVDIRIEAVFGENVPARTWAYPLVLSDKICKFKRDGSTLKVID